MSDYAELRGLVTRAGLLDKQPAYYIRLSAIVLGCYVLAMVVLVTSERPWILVLDAVLLAIVLSQIAFLGHDASHGQVFRSPKNTDAFCLACTLLIGVSYHWWTVKHNRHHSAPNHVDLDPDVRLSFPAFSEDQLKDARALRRLAIRHQAWLFFPILMFEGLALRAGSISELFRPDTRYRWIEAALIAGHILAFLAVVFVVLPFWRGVTFFVVHEALFGLIMGSAFAPNHKGMLIVTDDTDLDPLRRQVLTARNVRPNPISDFLLGGLNYQIEHHLFPRMPRNRLREAQRVVGAFCLAHAIPYHQTGLIDGYREALQHLHRVSAPLRQARPHVRHL